jgi:nucleotide-binding universal stress UspA family protein
MRVMKHASGDVTSAVQLGRPLEALIAAARDHAPDLIVMARPKRRRLDGMIGTTAERVIRSTGRSVLLVGTTAERAYERMILATDLTSTSEHVTRTIVSMGLLQNADAWVVHAFGLPYHNFATDEFNNIESSVRQEDWHATARRDVLRSLDDTGVDLARVHVSTELARPLTAIRHAMDQVQPELLVIGVSRWFALKRMMTGSVADQVFRSVDCDVLAVSPPPSERKWLRAA